MRIRFTKMHSLGNDFMVLDGITQSVSFTADQIKQLANRHTGIGFDQCLVIEASLDPSIDFFYRIYNADGTAVGQCGNGARCLARFVQHYRLSNKKTLRIATNTTRFTVSIQDDLVSAEFAPAEFSPDRVPLSFEKEQESYPISLANSEIIDVHALSVGNPHAVLCVDSVKDAAVHRIGEAISHHILFSQETNVEFVELHSPNLLKLRVYERGCGETLACGSGAVAAAVVARKFYAFDEKIQVMLPGGELTVYCPDPNAEIILSGPAEFVYEGVLMPLPPA